MDREVQEERSLGELFKELAAETSVLVKKEVELAKTEVSVKAKLAAKDGALVAGGAACAFFASLVLIAALILGLGTLMPLWVSALLVGLVLVGTAAGLAVTGVKKLQRLDAKPTATLRTLKENKLWLREQMSR